MKKRIKRGWLKYLISNGLVPKTKSGKNCSIFFKYDEQNRNGEYGEQFNASISQKDLINNRFEYREFLLKDYFFGSYLLFLLFRFSFSFFQNCHLSVQFQVKLGCG